VRAFAGTATLAWDPEISPSLVGYMVYSGPSAGNYTSSIDVGNTTTYTVSNLVEGATYHFAATAYDASHTQSGFSNDVSATVPYSAPVAQFSASTTSGTAPLALNFTSTSTGTISTYAWTFGDGTTSSAQNPSQVYSAAGVYTVSLTVTGPGGSNTQTRGNYITVSAAAVAPVAQFTASTTSGTAPLTVNFTSTSTGTISTYAWTFGDGTTSSAQNPSQVYSATGVYPVSLTVTGPGGSNTQTRGNYITVSVPVVGVTTTMLSSNPNPSEFGASVTFTATVVGTAPTGSVNFTDGGNSIDGCAASAVTGSSNVQTAICSTSSLSIGSHSIVATYAGDAANAPSTSAGLSEVVNAAGGTNVALASTGAVASASSTYSAAYPVTAINDNERAGANYNNGGYWNDATEGTFPDWVQINFNGSKSIDHVVVYSVQDNFVMPIEPTDTQTFLLYGITDFTVQAWDGIAWVTLGSVTGNNLVKRTVSFTPYTTDRIRINVTNALKIWSRITEVEAWGIDVAPE
jgi:PKD repeat protein